MRDWTPKRTVANGMKWSAGYEHRDGVGEHKTQENMYDENVRKLEFKFDIEKLKKALNEVLRLSDIKRLDQICLTYAPTFPPHPDGHEYQGAGSLIYEYYKSKDGVKSRPRPEGEYPPEISFTDFVLLNPAIPVSSYVSTNSNGS